MDGRDGRAYAPLTSNRILIIDDEPVNIALLKAMLVNVADEVCEVLDSNQAVQAFKDFAPDLVLLDLHMPQPDGLEILRQLRSGRDRVGFPPVIVLTESERGTAKNSALMLGADDFLTKPLDRHEVVLRVRNHLRTRHLLEEVQRSSGWFTKVEEQPQ